MSLTSTGLRRVGVGVVALSLMASVATGVAPARAQGADLGSLTGSIVSDGSSTVGPITQAIAEDFNQQAKDVKISVDISGTGGGFKRFCAAETDVQNASRAIKPDEATACAANGVDYYVFEVAYDGITVVTNPQNTWLTCLNVPALKQLWEKGSSVKNWSDLTPEFPSEPVALYGPGTDSGTFDYFTEEIIGKDGDIRTDFTPSEDDNVLVEGVAGDPHALGYFGFAYYEQNRDKLAAVAVDGGDGCVLPSRETIQDGSYKPLSRPLFIYVNAKSLERPEVAGFVQFYLDNAKHVAEDVGFVDSPDQVYADDAAKLEKALKGEGTPDSKAAPAEAAATPAA